MTPEILIGAGLLYFASKKTAPAAPSKPPPAPVQPPSYLSSCVQGAGVGATIGSAWSPVGTLVGGVIGCGASAVIRYATSED